MFHTVIAQIGVIAMGLVCALALWRGDAWLRLAAALLILFWIASGLVQDLPPGHKPQPLIFAIDLVYAFILFWISLQTPRLWAKFAAAFQVMVVSTHIAAWVSPLVTRWDFFTLYFVFSYLILGALAGGAIFEPRRPQAIRIT